VTSEQKREARRYLEDLMFNQKIPRFHERVRKDGDLRAAAKTGVQAAAQDLLRNPGELGEEKRYGITVEEADLVVDEFVRDMSGGL
jgi:citrate synthase